MAEFRQNRCLLTKKGEMALEALLKLAFPNANQTCIIDAMIGMDRTTAAHILHLTKSDKPTKPVNLNKLGEFFLTAFNRLDPTSQTEYLRNYPGLRLIYASPSIDEKYCSYAEFIFARDKYVKQIADLLWTLDYTEQEDIFRKLFPAKAIAISLAAPCSWTQQWLMRRLSRLVYEVAIVGGMPEVILLKPNDSGSKIKTSLSQWTLADICTPIATLLKTKERDSTQIIHKLAEYNTKQPVLIKVCGLRNDLDRQILIEKFWQPLTTQISMLNRNSTYLSYDAKKSPLMMFLLESGMEERDYGDARTLKLPCVLDPLQIDVEHVRQWITQSAVYDVLVARKNITFRDLHDRQVFEWSCWQEKKQQDRLDRMLADICKLFLADCKLADLTAHWKI
jgi:hypothetical protein